MTVSRVAKATPQKSLIPVGSRVSLLLIALVLGTVLLRLPSFFEPPWHTDEGIFEGVAQRVIHGGRLYADAWESKPPLFIYIYVAVIKVFGAGVLPLRLAATASAIGTELALFGVAQRFMDRRAAFVAAGALTVLLAVPFWEGTLALTEIFTVLPTTLAVLCVLRALSDENGWRRNAWFILAGLLFGVAFLIRQTSAAAGLAVLLWLLLSGRPWLRPGMLMALGGAGVVVPVVLGFALFGSFYWFWDANVGFFFDYVPSGRQLPFHYRPLIVLPTLAAIGALVLYRRRGETPVWGLPALWLTLMLAAALLTGRPYSHYFIQTFPPLALLIALTVKPEARKWRPTRQQWPSFALAGALALLWFGVVVPEFSGNVLAMRYSKAEDYYANFAGWALGLKSREAYDGYFDKRVRLTRRLDATLERLGARGRRVYIWGEYPWVYALTGSEPATPYMTSFYVLLIPYLDTGLDDSLAAADPPFVVVTADAWPIYYDATGVLQHRYRNATRALNGLLAERYEAVARVGRATVFRRTLDRPVVSGPHILAEPEHAVDETSMTVSQDGMSLRE